MCNCTVYLIIFIFTYSNSTSSVNCITRRPVATFPEADSENWRRILSELEEILPTADTVNYAISGDIIIYYLGRLTAGVGIVPGRLNQTKLHPDPDHG